MKLALLISLLAALADVVSGTGCGQLGLSFTDFRCGASQAVSNNARKVIYDAIEMSVEEFVPSIDVDLSRDVLEFFFTESDKVTGYPSDDELSQATPEELDSPNGNANGNANGNGNGQGRRSLKEIEQHQKSLDIEAILSGIPKERRLFDCPAGGLPYPYCYWYNCPFCTRRFMKAVEESGRSLQDVQNSICQKVQEVLTDGKGIGCLKGAQVTCDWLEPTRKDEGVVEESSSASDGSDGSSGDAAAADDSGAYSVVTRILPAALIGAVGFMAAAF